MMQLWTGLSFNPTCIRRSRNLVACAALAVSAFVAFNIVPGDASEITALHDNQRSGLDAAEGALTPAVLKSGRFGKVFDVRIDGQAYAQPLVLDSEVIVATEANKIYAIDTHDGKVRWQTQLGKPAPSDCYAASPQLGVHSTPAIDPESRTIYVVARTCEGPPDECGSPGGKNSGRLHSLLTRLRKLIQPGAGARYFLNALDASNGHPLAGWPVEIAGRASNDPGVAFDPLRHMQRAALLLLDGSVYAAFGGYCGGYPFRGWVAGINVETRKVKLWTDEAASADPSPQAGIWGAGGLVSDGPGSILIATGDGTLPPPGDGKLRVNALGNSVARLRVQHDGSLLAVDHFTPSNGKYLSDNDLDLGATAPAVLPDNFAIEGHGHLLLQASKNGMLYLLDRQNLGGENRASDTALAEAGPIGNIYAHPAVWPGDGGYIYLVSEGAGRGDIRAFRLGKDAAGATVLRMVGVGHALLGHATGSPIVTSDGTTGGSAIIWLIRRGGGGDQLQAYSAEPDSNGNLQLLWRAQIGQTTKFSVPASDSGRIFVATGDGHLLAFGER